MRTFLNRATYCLLGVISFAGGPAVIAEGPYQATGIKIGELTDASAIVWTRLTRNAQRNGPDAPMVKIVMQEKGSGSTAKKKKKVVAVEYPAEMDAGDIRDAVPGATGEVRVGHRAGGEDVWTWTEWKSVDENRDFTRQFGLLQLRPNTEYSVKVESRSCQSGPAGQTVSGRFRTAPPAEQSARVVFTVSTGQGYGSRNHEGGYRIYLEMLKLKPSFFVHTGDIVYYDRNDTVGYKVESLGLAKTEALARYHWQRTYSLPNNVLFHRQVPAYFMKDDHDTWQNDCWPDMQPENMGTFTFEPAIGLFQNPLQQMQPENMGTFTFEQGQAIFLEQVPMGASTYRTRRWGKDLQVWMVEGRDFRSANTDPDGPDKTIWGEKQKAWFKQTVGESDATFRVLISPTPLVGPDRSNKNDNHSNKGFTHEGDQLRAFIGSQKNMVVVCGDRHWQYVSVHPTSGVREYSCGPVSNKHAGGWKQEDYAESHHRYLNVIGGFLSATVERIDGRPTLAFRHHGVDGSVKHEDRLVAD